jgi:hypothetical protein
MRRKRGQRVLYRHHQRRTFLELLVMRPALLRLLPQVFARSIIRGIRRQGRGGAPLARSRKQLLGGLARVIPGPILEQHQGLAGLSHAPLQKRLGTLGVEPSFAALRAQTAGAILNGTIPLVAVARATGRHCWLSPPPRSGITEGAPLGAARFICAQHHALATFGGPQNR